MREKERSHKTATVSLSKEKRRRKTHIRIHYCVIFRLARMRYTNVYIHRFTWVFLSRWEFSVSLLFFIFSSSSLSFNRFLLAHVYFYYNSFCAEDFWSNYDFLGRTFMYDMQKGQDGGGRDQISPTRQTTTTIMVYTHVYYGCAQFMTKGKWQRMRGKFCFRLSTSD